MRPEVRARAADPPRQAASARNGNPPSRSGQLRSTGSRCICSSPRDPPRDLFCRVCDFLQSARRADHPGPCPASWSAVVDVPNGCRRAGPRDRRGNGGGPESRARWPPAAGPEGTGRSVRLLGCPGDGWFWLIECATVRMRRRPRRKQGAGTAHPPPAGSGAFSKSRATNPPLPVTFHWVTAAALLLTRSVRSGGSSRPGPPQRSACDPSLLHPLRQRRDAPVLRPLRMKRGTSANLSAASKSFLTETPVVSRCRAPRPPRHTRETAAVPYSGATCLPRTPS